MHDPGVYVLDVATATTRRLLDAPAPASRAGDGVLYGVGLDVFRIPVGGGTATRVYTMPDLVQDSWIAPPAKIDHQHERITGISASPDGHAAIAVEAPYSGGGVIGTAALMDPTGQEVTSLDSAGPFEWSSDGQTLVTWRAGSGLEALRPDGSVVWGPVGKNQAGPVRIRIAPDGSAVLLAYSQNVMVGEGDAQRYDVRTGQFAHIPDVRSTPTIGLDGRILGARGQAQGATSGTIEDDVIFDPASGTATTFPFPGDVPAWSPSGRNVAIFGPRAEPVQGYMPSVRILDPTATASITIDPAAKYIAPVGVGDTTMAWWDSPEWTPDGRSLIFTVTDGGAAPNAYS